MTLTLGHSALRDRPSRLAAIRQASIRTFAPEWDLAVERLLWGLDLRINDLADRSFHEARVCHALADPLTVRHIGRSGWMDLYADWIHYHIDQNTVEGPRIWADHWNWCAANGYEGWAKYWRAHRPTRTLTE